MKFKVGDWVRSKENKFDFSLVSIDTEKFYKALGSNFEDVWELWQPKEGEWCWFYSDVMKLDNVGILRKFTQMEKDIQGDDMFGCEPMKSFKEEFEHIKVFYKYCEPFIGNLPSFIKGE